MGSVVFARRKACAPFTFSCPVARSRFTTLVHQCVKQTVVSMDQYTYRTLAPPGQALAPRHIHLYLCSHLGHRRCKGSTIENKLDKPNNICIQFSVCPQNGFLAYPCTSHKPPLNPIQHAAGEIEDEMIGSWSTQKDSMVNQ